MNRGEIMDLLYQFWESAGRPEQSITAVVMMAAAYISFRAIILKRLGKIAASTNNDADIKLAKEAALEAIGSVPGVIAGTSQIVVRSLWDDSRGHLLAGVLLEGRYRIEDVRKRIVIRSKVLEGILQALRSRGIPFPAQPVRLLSEENQ